MGLSRRRESNSVLEIAEAIEIELKDSASSIGYRAMHRRLQMEHGLVPIRETVQKVLKIVDHEGVERRLRRRFKRRQYKVKGPNYI